MDPVTLANYPHPSCRHVLFILIRMFRVIPEYERGISFRFGHPAFGAEARPERRLPPR